jgi:hypothetical protein
MSHTADTDRTIRRRSIGSRGSTTRTECRKFFLCAHGREEPKWSERWWTRSDHDPERAHACVYSFYPWSAAGTAFSVGLDHVHLHYITPAGSSSEQWFWCSVLLAGTKELGPIVFTQMHQHPQQHCLWQWERARSARGIRFPITLSSVTACQTGRARKGYLHWVRP